MRREWLLIPVFLPGEFRGQKSLVGYSPWGCKELETSEWLTHTVLFPGWCAEVLRFPPGSQNLPVVTWNLNLILLFLNLYALSSPLVCRLINIHTITGLWQCCSCKILRFILHFLVWGEHRKNKGERCYIILNTLQDRLQKT